MVQVSRSDRDVIDLEFAFDQLVVVDLGAHFIEPHREIGILHLPGQRFLDGLPDASGRVNVPFVSWHKKRSKERNALNVIPMSMTNEDVTL